MRRLFLLCSLSCLILAGCNRTETSSQPAPAAPARSAAPVKVPDFESVPLTQEHVDLYISTMKAAAEKRRAVSDPADLKALEFEAKETADLKAHPHRPYHKYTDEEFATLKRADQLHYLDEDVAQARGNIELYTAIRNVIEGTIGPRKCPASDCGEGRPEDLALLKPQEAELLALMKQVRQ